MVDAATDSIDPKQQERPARSVILVIISKGAESTQDREKFRYTSRRGDQRKENNAHKSLILILIQNAFVVRKQDTHELTIYLEETTFETKDGRRKRRRKKKSMKRSTSTIDSRQDTRTGDPNHVKMTRTTTI